MMDHQNPLTRLQRNDTTPEITCDTQEVLLFTYASASSSPPPPPPLPPANKHVCGATNSSVTQRTIAVTTMGLLPGSSASVSRSATNTVGRHVPATSSTTLKRHSRFTECSVAPPVPAVNTLLVCCPF